MAILRAGGARLRDRGDLCRRGQGVTAIVLLTVLMGATALVGIAALRTLRPLVTPEEDRTAMIGHRTRAALEREKMLALRAIKELEFDRAMGKVSDSDWQEMSGRLRTRATRLMRQLDAGVGYREQIERDLAKRLGRPTDARERIRPRYGGRDPPTCRESDRRAARRARPSTTSDARFCKECGQKLCSVTKALPLRSRRLTQVASALLNRSVSLCVHRALPPCPRGAVS